MAQRDSTSASGTFLLPPRATSDGTHRRLLEAALVLFGARGYHGVSVREVARAAGIQASSIYSHLESKEQLLFELMSVGHDEHQEMLRHALLESGPEPEDQVDHLVRAHVRLHVSYPLLARICNRELAALGDANRERVLSVRRQSEQFFTDVIERGVRLGVFEVPDAWLATAAVAAMGLRLAEWWDGSQPYTFEQVAGAYSLYALRILRP